MANIIENLPTLLTFIGIVFSAYWGPKAVARIQGKHKISEVKAEGDSKAEELYVKEMPLIIKEYKEQVSGFREELVEVKREFAEFREQHKKEVAEYKKQIKKLELLLENRDQEIIDLKGILKVKEKIIREMKGD